MTKEQALRLWNELHAFVGDQPGHNQLALDLVKKMQFQIETSPNCDAYIREKMCSVVGSFDTWFSPRKWQKWNQEHLQSILHNDLHKLKNAIQDIAE